MRTSYNNHPSQAAALLLLLLVTSQSCSSPGSTSDEPDLDKGDDNADSDLSLDDADGQGTDDVDLTELPAPASCGDGVLDDVEACDDGNRTSEDGCYQNCLLVEPGFICSDPGEPCRPFAKCGDGRVTFPEQCDDGNETEGDGCSAYCKTEIGSKCDGEPSVCTETVCGDMIPEGAEGCDDGNAIPFDGCDEHCQWEPTCSAPGTSEGCSSFCGDGILFGAEQCDDGNSLSGDGCSEACEQEEGYTCNPAPCDMVGSECVLRVSAVFRDFLDAHENFATGGGSITTGLALESLDAEGKPVYSGLAGASLSASANLNSWYRDGAEHSTVVGELILFSNDQDGYVNRFLPDGTPYENASGALIDGTPLFFPLDSFPLCQGEDGEGEERVGCALTDTTHLATIPGEPGTYEATWIAETPAAPHNFSFTTEVSYWFEYDSENPPTLDFLGDDDVWVFVNGKLAVDLGGLHVPLAETLTLDQATNTDFALGLQDGNVYPISIFHAERNPTGSSFRLTLSGFRAQRSLCLPDCGDGVVAGSEECDDAMNDGGYNECQPGCVLAAYCGDGVVSGDEVCDDRDPDAPSNCSGCRVIIVQ